MPGNGPHRFGVDNKRKLAFLPNAAPGWKNRVIWTLDIKDPLKPEVDQHLGPALDEGRRQRWRRVPAIRPTTCAPCTARR